MKFKKVPIFNHYRFFSKIIKEDNGCWRWNATTNNQGYGTIWIGSTFQAHRVSYSIHFGIEGSDTAIDHKCRNRACVNPDHLREVDWRINAIENSIGRAAKMIVKTHCIYGHEFTDENTIKDIGIYGGTRRHCRLCKRRIARDWARRNAKKRKE